MIRFRLCQNFAGFPACNLQNIRRTILVPLLWCIAIGKLRVIVIALHSIQCLTVPQKVPGTVQTDILNYLE